MTSSPISATVKLLRGLHLPARYAKVVNFNAGLNTESSKQSLMFEPAQQELKEYGLQLEPSIVEPQKNTESVCTVGIVIENPNAYLVFLPADQLIGHLQSARCLSQEEEAKVLHSQVSFISNNSPHNPSDSQQRCKVILDQIHVDRSNLQDKECATLEALIREYADLFALK